MAGYLLHRRLRRRGSRRLLTAHCSAACRQIGTAFGIAFLGALLTNRYNAQVHDGVLALAVPGVPPQQAPGILHGIVSGIQQAGTFAASTGFRTVPSQFAQFAQQPLFPQIQRIVQGSFIASLQDIFRVAAVILAVAALAVLALVKKADMRHASEDEPVSFGA